MGSSRVGLGCFLVVGLVAGGTIEAAHAAKAKSVSQCKASGRLRSDLSINAVHPIGRREIAVDLKSASISGSVYVTLLVARSDSSKLDQYRASPKPYFEMLSDPELSSYSAPTSADVIDDGLAKTLYLTGYAGAIEPGNSYDVAPAYYDGCKTWIGPTSKVALPMSAAQPPIVLPGPMGYTTEFSVSAGLSAYVTSPDGVRSLVFSVNGNAVKSFTFDSRGIRGGVDPRGEFISFFTSGLSSADLNGPSTVKICATTPDGTNACAEKSGVSFTDLLINNSK